MSEPTAHETAVNNCIPKAERMANAKLELADDHYVELVGKDGNAFNYCMWTEYFHEAMNMLTKRAGIRC
jgi:hypothetical protein